MKSTCLQLCSYLCTVLAGQWSCLPINLLAPFPHCFTPEGFKPAPVVLSANAAVVGPASLWDSTDLAVCPGSTAILPILVKNSARQDVMFPGVVIDQDLVSEHVEGDQHA